jgi:2-polyprenyl-3-methyl-5-hydroxy-6-metoxy-1,4-benzoquinol methylase
MTTYLYPHDWEGESRRLATIEALWDPATTARLESVGIGPGWHCLEVGGGSGSIAAWMAERVGPAGRVTVTDIDVTHLQALAGPNLEVQLHDVMKDGLPADTYDLVHARLLLKHLPDRDRAIANLVSSLRPGGWLVVEDTDWTGAGLEPPEAAFDEALRGLRGLMEAAGGIHDYGRLLYRTYTAAGLVDVGVEGTFRAVPCGTPAVDVYRLTFGQVHGRLVESGLIDETTYTLALEALDDSDRVAILPVLVGARGRKLEPQARGDVGEAARLRRVPGP